jgi:hypothetical protein
MSLATKNNALIVKDGNIAENCACCGGWYCYESDCPCRYSGTLPSTLKMTIAVSVSSTIYGVFATNWLQSYVAPLRFTRQQLQAMNGTYTLTKVPQQYLEPCVYHLNSYQFSGGSTDINQPSALLTVGTQSGLFYSTAGQLCDASQSGVKLVEFGITAQGTVGSEIGNINNFYTFCQGCSVSLNSAASRKYGTYLFPATFSSRIAEQDVSQYGCGFSRCWFNGGSFGGTYPAVAGEYDFPPCESGNISRIDHTWAFDLLYTDTSGTTPTRTNIHRAVSVRVFE